MTDSHHETPPHDAEPADPPILTAEEERMLRAALTVPGASEVLLPEYYSRVVTILEDCDRLDECRSYVGKADMIKVYAKQARDPHMIALSKRINARAWRRLGELLQKLPQGRFGPTGLRGKLRSTSGYARDVLNALSPTDRRLSMHIANKAGAPVAAVKRILSGYVSAGFANGATGPTGGFLLTCDPASITDEQLAHAITAGSPVRRVEHEVPREETLRAVAERHGITTGEQSKALRIADIERDIFDAAVESPRSVSGYQLLMIRNGIRGSDNSAYGLGPGNMRNVILREIGEFRDFVARERAADVLRAYGPDRISLQAQGAQLRAWFLLLQKKLEHIR
jgi:DNA-binding IscR family transcriptional regulator